MTGRQTKSARARARETEKADKALGGAQLVSGEDKPHYHAELQWFRLLRGQSRLNQIARILVELAPASVFDPKHIYKKQLEEEQKLKETSNDDQKKKGKNGKTKKPSKKELIIAANKAKLQKEAAARDAEKLRSLGGSAQSNIKLKTDSGKFLLLNQILRKAVKEKNVIDALDTLWEIEEVSKEISPEEAKSVMKDNSKSYAAALEMRSSIKEYIPKGISPKPKNLVEFQLTCMSDRLPPLSLHSLKGKFKLDPWQMKVLNLIMSKKSVLITAPTSCGKTVLSTFVCGVPETKTLFVVPTEPLAWQVAAMLRALKLGISLIVPTLTFVPPSYDVVVGTPQALESTLTKQVGFDFDFAVYDEVHSLNTSGGEALQRLIKLMPESCRVLALSATIGNAEDMLKWWQNILGGNDTIELVQHKARFINLQRHIWTYNLKKLGVELAQIGDELEHQNKVAKGKLRHLHPCLSLSAAYLASDGFNHNDLAFTPVDTFNLYKSMDILVAEKYPDILKGLKPRKFFPNTEKDRITLVKAKEYEDALKAALQKVAKCDTLVCKKVIASLAPDADPKTVQKLETEEKVDAFFKTHVNDMVEESKQSNDIESLTALLLNLKRNAILPAILFQLDSVRCQSYFDGLLTMLEQLEKLIYPTYHDDLLVKEKQQQKAREIAIKSSKGKKQGEENAMEDAEFSADVSVDVSAPHPDLSLSPPGRGVGATEAKNLVDALSYDLPKTGDVPHPLIRGLRRGIGLYISGLPASYHRVVQSYAQSGRLGLVLSDELLAYGVNMPFRTAVFFDDPGSHWLTPLVHQQMAGRAGRRGLDRQGHLVYAGFTVERLQQLLRGELPDILGRFPLYPTVPLQLFMNERFVNTGTPLTERKMAKMCSIPLAQFIRKESNKDLLLEEDNYFQTAQQWINHLGVMNHPNSSYKDLIPELVWELRQFLPESLALEFMIESIVAEFKHIPVQQNDSDVKHQERICLIFSLICSRKPAFYFLQEHSSLDEIKDSVLERLYEKSELSESCLKFVGELGEKERDRDEWQRWITLVAKSQERILNADLKYKFNLLLPTRTNVPLDNMCHSAFQRNQVDPNLPTPLQHELRERLWTVGEVLRICTNVLGRSKELAGLTNLIRKSFVRIRYILDETSQRNWKALNQQNILQENANETESKQFE